MKWTKKIPQQNDVRLVRRFAFRPKCVARTKDKREETWVWFGFYYMLQKFDTNTYPRYGDEWHTKFSYETNPYPNGDLPRGETLG